MQLLACAKQAIRADRAVRDPSKWGWRNNLEQREISHRNLLINWFWTRRTKNLPEWQEVLK